MSELSLPSLRWDPERACWIPYRGLNPAPWPEEVDQAALPRPAYRVGTRVYFRWIDPRPWEGEIRMIEIRGGPYQPWDDIYDVIAERYYRPDALIYSIQARGHIRLVRASKIVGISTNTDLRPLLEHGYEEF